MDINQWLENTSAPEEKSLAARLGIPSFLQPVNPEPHSPRYKRKRQRASRDSSLLEDPVPQQRYMSRAQSRVSQDILDSDDQPQSSDHSTASSASAATSAELYRRRSRKKTKVDKYHPKSGKPKKRRQEISNGRNQTKTGRKVRRKEKSGVGFVHTFHAKNVAKDRLTVSCQKNQRKHGS